MYTATTNIYGNGHLYVFPFHFHVPYVQVPCSCMPGKSCYRGDCNGKKRPRTLTPAKAGEASKHEGNPKQKVGEEEEVDGEEGEEGDGDEGDDGGPGGGDGGAGDEEEEEEKEEKEREGAWEDLSVEAMPL